MADIIAAVAAVFIQMSRVSRAWNLSSCSPLLFLLLLLHLLFPFPFALFILSFFFLVIFFRYISLTFSTGVLKGSIMAAADEPKMAPGQSRREAREMPAGSRRSRCPVSRFLDSRTQQAVGNFGTFVTLIGPLNSGSGIWRCPRSSHQIGRFSRLLRRLNRYATLPWEW